MISHCPLVLLPQAYHFFPCIKENQEKSSKQFSEECDIPEPPLTKENDYRKIYVGDYLVQKA